MYVCMYVCILYSTLHYMDMISWFDAICALLSIMYFIIFLSLSLYIYIYIHINMNMIFMYT